MPEYTLINGDQFYRMESIQFTIPEILALIGMTQCVYVLVYILFRAGRFSRAGIPLLYFFFLCLAFLSDLAEIRIDDIRHHYSFIKFFAWFYGPPLSVLLIIQIAQITKTPALRHYWVILLIPAAYAVSVHFAQDRQEMQEWLVVSGLVAGAISLLAIWMNRGLFDSILAQKTGKERYWLILAIIFMNVFFLMVMFMSLSPNISDQDVMFIRTVLGLGFVYLASTSLFRIYPQPLSLSSGPGKSDGLSSEEQEIAQKIERLMVMDKVYHEASYTRTDLARECDTSETVISRIINVHFRKSFPQLMNEHRIEDAKRLLVQTEAPIRTVAEEVGFNSLPSFNRVFKEMSGDSPSDFRKKKTL